MNYLLDTTVVSEWAKPVPNPRVVRWFDEIDEDRSYLSVVTLAEIRRGIERLPPGSRQKRLDTWLQEDLPGRFAGRILDIDARVADAWGRIFATAERRGHPIGNMDAFIAATAVTSGLTLVTRNVRDFAYTGVAILNPWTV